MNSPEKTVLTPPLPTRTPRKSSRFFYGYTIVFAAVFILIVMHGINSSFGVFFTPLQDEFGWNRATISGAASLAFLLTGFFSTIAGKATDRYGPKWTLSVSAVVLGFAYLLMGRIQSAWQLYLFYGFLVAIGQSGGDMGLLPTVARWFVRRRSLMSSIVKVGTGIGMFSMPLISAWLITSFDWRIAYTVLAAVALVVIFSFSLLLKKDPSDMGLRPYGEAEARAANHGVPTVNMAFRDVLRTRQFWIVCATYFLIWYATQSAMIHIAPRGVDTGMSVAQAAGIVSIIGAGSILGRISVGVAGDRIGTRRAVVICAAILVAMMTWLQFVRAPWMLYAFAPIYGFAHGGSFAIVSPLIADLFGLRSHASNLGLLFFLGMSGGAIGPIVTGRLYDTTHSYGIAFAIMLGAAAMSLVLALALKPVRVPLAH
jgi:MFS family permease